MNTGVVGLTISHCWVFMGSAAEEERLLVPLVIAIDYLYVRGRGNRIQEDFLCEREYELGVRHGGDGTSYISLGITSGVLPTYIYAYHMVCTHCEYKCSLSPEFLRYVPILPAPPQRRCVGAPICQLLE